ncbi:MAG: SpoVA/SpoVAEb family sporulation membrane protein [Clostridia bacterium]|nr:SpoVA/SpoVAEb family sporulation membrane protein [Clostridia bacterium]
MNMDRETYKKYAKGHAPKSPVVKNCVKAFLFGGGICAFAQLLTNLYSVWGLNDEDSGLLASVTLVFLAALLTGIGVFDRIAKHAGAGTLVPITGFANSVVSPAIDTKAEGLVLGVGAKIFTVAGPVLLYATLAGTPYGVIYWVCKII